MANWKEDYAKKAKEEEGKAADKRKKNESAKEKLEGFAKKLAAADYGIEKLICPELLPFASLEKANGGEEMTREQLSLRSKSLDKKKECEGKFKVVVFCGDKSVAKNFSFEIRLESLKGPATILYKDDNFYLMRGFVQKRFGDPYKVWNIFHGLNESLIDTLLRNMRKNLPLHEDLPEAYKELQDKRQWF